MPRTFRRPLAALALAGLVALAAAPCVAREAAESRAAAAMPKGMRLVTSVEGIDELRLDNGLRLLLFPDASKQTATVNMTVLVGSRHEGLGESGMAHLLEHMLFKGTPRYPDPNGELTKHGTRPNGSTWYDRTNYFETFAATDENVDWAIDFEADRLVNCFLRAEDLASEMTVVRNEFEAGENDPAGVLMSRVISDMYLWHNYGKDTIGSRADIERVPIENLRAFYETWYRPDNVILVVAGRFDRAKVLQRVASTFGKLPKPKKPLPVTWTEEPAQDGERTVSLRRVGDAQGVIAGYHVPAGSHPDFAAVEVLAHVLGDTPSGRLYEALVKAGKASQVGAWAAQLHDPGFLLLTATLAKDADVAAARQAIAEVSEKAATTPPSDEEVARAKQALLKQWEDALRNSEWAAINLSEWAALGDWRLMFLHRDRLEKVTAADVQRVAAAYLRPTNRTIGTYVPTDSPERTPVPPRPDVAAMLSDYSGREALAQGEAFDPSPAAIEARLLRKTIAPGLKLVMLPKKTRGATVTASVRLNLGNAEALHGRAGAGDACGDMLMRGTTKRSRQQIQDELDRLKATLRVNGDATSAGGGLETVRASLPEVLRLLAEVLREPSFPAAELELLKQEDLQATEASRRDPQQACFTTLMRHVNPWPEGDPRRVLTVDETLAQIRATTLDDVRRFHADFYGASSGQIAIVGDFDPAEIEALLTELFAGWESKTPFRRLEDPYREVPALDERIEIADKESGVFGSSLGFRMRDDDADYAAVEIAAFMTGGGFLSSRLATRLREKEGLCYGVGAWLSVPALDDAASLGGFAIYAPQNADKLESGFREEIAKVAESGFTQEELDEARRGWLQEQQVSRAQDGELAGLLASNEYLGRTLAFQARLEEAMSALTAAQVNAAAKKHLDPARMSVVMAGSFASPPAAAAP